MTTWAEVHWRSETLEMDTTMQVLIPRTGTPPYPTLYLLHSLKDDSSAWLRRTRLEDLVRDLPLIVAMPDGYRGFFTDNEEGPAFARYLGQEVVDFVEHTFPARSDRHSRAIGGASMGGYGALRVGLAYSDRFCSIHSQCGALDRKVQFRADQTNRAAILQNRSERFISEMRRVFGERPEGSTHDVLRLALEAKERGTVPDIWIDCGTSDNLIASTRDLHLRLDEAAIRHTYHEFPGGHGWEYCAAHIEEALSFHATNLKIARKA